jgi:hypothetical protein
MQREGKDVFVRTSAATKRGGAHIVSKYQGGFGSASMTPLALTSAGHGGGTV